MWNTRFCNHQRKTHSILGREFPVTFLSLGLANLTNSGPVWMQNSYCLLLGHILGMGGLWFCRNSHVNFWIWYASDGLTFCSQIGCKKKTPVHFDNTVLHGLLDFSSLSSFGNSTSLDVFSCQPVSPFGPCASSTYTAVTLCGLVLLLLLISFV